VNLILCNDKKHRTLADSGQIGCAFSPGKPPFFQFPSGIVPGLRLMTILVSGSKMQAVVRAAPLSAAMRPAAGVRSKRFLRIVHFLVDSRFGAAYERGVESTTVTRGGRSTPRCLQPPVTLSARRASHACLAISPKTRRLL